MKTAISSGGLLIPAARAPGAGSAEIVQVATYPKDGDLRVPPNATAYFVFNQPTSKSGVFEMADLDSGVLINLQSPRWSALGDTVFLTPLQPMPFGHQMGMRVDLIFAPADTAADLPIVYFSILPRANVQRIPPGNEFTSVTLIPGTPVPVAVNARETAGDAATFTSARVAFWPTSSTTWSAGSPPPSPLYAYTVPVAFTVPAFGSAQLSAPVALPKSLAANAASGLLGLSLIFDGYDETGLPYSFAATSAIELSPSADTTLVTSIAQVTPSMASNLVVREVIVESPLPGAMYAAGDTVRARAVVTGDGTGAFRAVFYIDGSIVAIEEGYMESGRPVTVKPQGPMPARRFGEHRFQFVVEAPQNVAAQPLYKVPPEPDSIAITPPPFTLGGTWMADAMSEYQNQSGSLVGWSGWNARYDLKKGRKLEGNVLWRVNITDPENGSASPEQFLLRASSDSGAVEWGDLAPRLASGAPLFASAVPRRAAQASWAGTPVGTFEAFVALESHPRSCAGPIESIRSDLYAGRLTRAVGGDRFTASLYGGYIHDDPTPAGAESLVFASGVYGGMGTLRFGKGWTLLGDIATVHHKEIAGVVPAQSPTAVRGVLSGTVAGFGLRADAFRYQPNMATALNPYALSDRKGTSAELTKDVLQWNFFGGYRKEKPDAEVGLAPVIEVTRYTAGARLKLNAGAYVTPAYIHISNKGSNTDFTEDRAATEFSTAEALGGRTTARIDIAQMDDGMIENAKTRIVSASLVSTRLHEKGVSTTLSGGYEGRDNIDQDLLDQTIQAAIEMRIEAKPGRLLITPFLTWMDRDYQTLIQEQHEFTGRLQVAFLRLPHLGESVLAIEGRITSLSQTKPIDTESTEGSVTVTLGQRYQILGGR